jgi:hypothetical protein
MYFDPYVSGGKAGLIGDHHELRPGAGAELDQQPAHVGLRGRGAEPAVAGKEGLLDDQLPQTVLRRFFADLGRAGDGDG